MQHANLMPAVNLYLANRSEVQIVGDDAGECLYVCVCVWECEFSEHGSEASVVRYGQEKSNENRRSLKFLVHLYIYIVASLLSRSRVLMIN